ncbi:MAG: hypothetical protein JNM76_12255 [Betaproteobacteria bacterium]|nr:hypothetical protein [Betaproteobacteria bacterium]
MGILTARGSIDISQFWPQGTSDADTANIYVDVAQGGVFYTAPGKAERDVTNLYKSAVSAQKKTTTDLSKETLIKQGKIKVRLQGIDAPELHYKPQSDPRTAEKLGVKGAKLGGAGVVKDYRQHQAETSAVSVGRFLATIDASAVPCEFVSNVDDSEGPSAVVDKYGRFVGDIIVDGNVNLNHWILEKGWAVVSLYNSMTEAELDGYISHWRKGRNKGSSRHYADRVIAFKPGLLLRHHATPVSEGDARFLHPKLYRRQTTWWAYKQVAPVKLSFPKSIAATGGNLFEIADFRENGRYAQAHPLAAMLAGSQMALNPEEFVLREDAGDIFDLNRDKITSW